MKAKWSNENPNPIGDHIYLTEYGVEFPRCVGSVFFMARHDQLNWHATTNYAEARPGHRPRFMTAREAMDAVEAAVFSDLERLANVKEAP